MKLSETQAAEDGRFHRQEIITWWDQGVLAKARILVVGAGAVGNEILKNLALLGVGNVFVVDFDTIELSNLSRTVLFRESDLGRRKAEAAAEAVRAIYPGIAVAHLHGNVVYDLGLGVYRWADVVLCGLDNREGRLQVNRSCWKTSTPWLDGAIEGLDGLMRLFAPPDGPCYECTMSKLDWQLLAARRSCSLLRRDEMEAGKVPTTSTVSSIIAGLQCQEAVKVLHRISTLAGKGIVFSGMAGEFHPVVYQRKDECYSHETLPEPTALGLGVGDITLGDLLARARTALGPDAVIELNNDVLHELECPNCHTRDEALTSLGKVAESDAACPACGAPRIAHVLSEIDPECGLLDKAPGQIGVPPFDVLTARSGDGQIAFLFDGDAERVLGELDVGE